MQRLVISANIRTCINAVLKAEGVTAKCEINVLVTDDAGIREINRTSRNIDSATDVLSFPMFELAPGELPTDWTEYEDPDTGLVPLGDMCISLERAIAQAKEFGAKAFQMNMTEDDLKELMASMTMSATASYDNNLQKLGYVDFANPSQISIYPMDFESKEKVVKILDSYNSRMEKEGKEEQIITYTDIVGTLMSSVTNIVDIISYVLIAFVAISLVVSSIMIGVITYISVLERKKEIGILRAIGASKRNVSQVFNAETVIIGLCAGLIGIGLSLLLLIPGNMIIHAVADNNKINAFLPVLPAIVLILLSIGLTLLGGIIPSRKAAKSDPVTALRTE